MPDSLQGIDGLAPAVDPKTAQRLRARRIVVVDADVARAQAFAQALWQSGATVETVTPADADLQAAHALDADVLLVNEDEPEPCRALVLALRDHPRTRWSTVLPASFAALWPSDAEQPDVASIADQVSGFATALVELTVRAKGKLPHDAPLEPLGPSRSLRVLASVGRNLRVVLSDGRVRTELELTEDGRVGGARAWIADAEAPLSDAAALSTMLSLSSGQLRIEERGEPSLPSWNVELPAALASAAAMTQARGLHPTVPQLSFAQILEEARARARESGCLPALEPAPARDHDSEPPVPVMSATAAMAAMPAIKETREPPVVERRGPKVARARRRPRAFAIAFALLGVGALAFALYARTGGHDAPRSERPAAAYSGSLATAVARSEPPPPAAVAAPTPEPAVHADAPLLDAPPQTIEVPREPTRSELEQAKRIAKRAHRYLRDQRYATAALAYEKVLALVPTHTVATRALVRIHLHEQRAGEAVRWAEQLVRLEPDDSVSHLLLGDAHALGGDAALAEQAWQRAVALGSDAAGKRLRKP